MCIFFGGWPLLIAYKPMDLEKKQQSIAENNKRIAKNAAMLYIRVY